MTVVPTVAGRRSRRAVPLAVVLAVATGLAALPVSGPLAPSPALAGRPFSSALSAAAPGLQARLETVLNRTRLETAIPGLSVSVRFPDGTSWDGVSGFADVAHGTLVTPETPFSLASISKTFVAAVVMGLVEEGRLYLGDSAARLLPGVKLGSRPIDPRITVRQLLDHTSGLRDYLSTSAIDRAVTAAPTTHWSVSRALSYVGKPVAAPGVRFAYSNTNFVVLGLIVERITGHPLATEIRARLLDPLGLTTATYQGVEAPASTPTLAYTFATKSPKAPPIDVTDGTAVRPFTAITTAAGPAGSMMASAHDAAVWMEDLLTGHAIAPRSVTQMTSDARRTVAVDPGYRYGLGIVAYNGGGRLAFGHSGRLIGQRALVLYYPDLGLTIAVLTNQSRSDPAIVLHALLAVLLPSNAGRAPHAR